METTTEKQKKKRKQGPKPGKVVRINPTTLKLISSEMKNGESTVSVIERLVKAANSVKKGKTYYILPSLNVVCESLPDAKGKAILAAVLKKTTEVETPIAVKEIS